MAVSRPSLSVIASGLVVVLVGAGHGAPATAQEGAGLALPDADQRAADLEIVVDDTPAVPPAVFDTDAAGEVALARIDLFAGPNWDIADLVERMSPEPEAAYAFVRDHIGFDPYAGVLRGAEGTLVARAGNAWDRALLLQAMLQAQGHEAGLVSGPLDDAAAADVESRALAGPARPLVDPDPAEVLGLDPAALAQRARRDDALLAEGLGNRLAAAGNDFDAGLLEAVREHAWVQVTAEDGSVVDLDPTFPSAEAGATLTSATETHDTPPADLRHGLRVTVIAETLADGQLAEQTLLDTRLDAIEAADAETWLTFQAEQGGIGGALLDALTDVSWVPILSIDGEAMQGTSFTVGSSGDVTDFFFGDETAGELTGLRVELASEGPGLEPLTARRVLLDRVDPTDRVSGSVDPERLMPLPPPGEVLPALSGIHQVLSSNGASDLRSHAVNRAIALGWGAAFHNEPEQADNLKLFDLLYPLAVANQTMVLASEQLLTDGIGLEGTARAFVGRPRGYLVSLVPYPEVEDGTAIITDLALDSIDVVTAPGTPGTVEAEVRRWHGALQQALETELTLARAAAVSPDTLDAWSVSLEMDGPLELVTPDQIETVPADRTELRAALAAGHLALSVPNSPHGSFWAVDPVTGRTRSVSETGLRPGHIGGGNYVNSSAGGPRYVIDPKTGNTLGTIRDGRFTPAKRPPPSRCSGGTEYIVVLGCVSIPASMTVGMTYGVIVTALVSWAAVILQLL